MKLIYMHMAKTAGSSVNAFFADAFGQDRCAEHIERFDHTTRMGLYDQKDFLSGHIYAPEVLKLSRDRENDYLFTFMRDPLQQIASHIHWLDHYNEPDYRAELRQFGEPLIELIKAIRAVDFGSPEDLDHLMTHLPQWGIRMLDNMQTRYLGGDTDYGPLSMRDAKTAIRMAAKFDRIGFVEDMDESLERIVGESGLSLPVERAPRVNEAKSSRVLDTKNPMIRMILNKRIIVDRYVYNSLRRRQTAADAERGGARVALEAQP